MGLYGCEPAGTRTGASLCPARFVRGFSSMVMGSRFLRGRWGRRPLNVRVVCPVPEQGLACWVFPKDGDY